MLKSSLLSALILATIVGPPSAAPTSQAAARTSATHERSGKSAKSLVYVNEEYGFRFSLPETWNGYSIVRSTWGGDALAQTGRVISIRNPLWISADPHQDIPIMIFSIAQWNDLHAGKFHIGAAPINPSELGRNSKYVFAVPARYNYEFPTGYEEVDRILRSNPLTPFEPKAATRIGR